jgi:hypothetical protein
MDRSEGNDDPALTAHFSHNTLSPRKDAVPHSYPCSHGDEAMGPQEQSAGQPDANPVEFRAAYHVPFFLAQQAKYAGNGDDRTSVLRREAGKHISRKERPLHDCDAVGPLYTLAVER